MTEDTDTSTPTTPGPPPRRRGLSKRGASIATAVGLSAGGLVGGIVISKAADPSPSPAAATSPSGSTSSPAATPGTATSNEDPTHETGESSQRESDENSGNFRGHGGPGGPGFHGGPGGAQGEDAQVVAGAIGLTTTQLQTELSAGKTIAQVAQAHSVDVTKVISAWVASENTEIDDRVASGQLTKAQGDQAKTMTQQRVTDEVNGTRSH